MAWLELEKVKFPDMKSWDVFLFFVAIRLSSVAVIQTFFVPDEYWQSLEVAHKMVFGFGYLTWEWKEGIRSYAYPLVFSLLYKVLAVFQLDFPEVLIYSPRVLQAVISAYADYSFYEWSGTKKWGIFSIATSWFWFYCSSRTLINTFEFSLTSIALSKFPWQGKVQGKNVLFILLIAILCAVRPTAAIVWTPMVLYHLILNKHQFLSLVLKNYVPICFSILAASIVLDSWAHGSFVVTSYNFVKFNYFNDVASFYGQHPWFWYLSIGLPAVLGIQFIPFVVATLIILKNRAIHQNELAILSTIVFSVAIYSALPHKEFRFLLPILPFVLYISSRFLSAWSRKANKMTLWAVAGIIFLANLVPVWYLGMVHQTGTLTVMQPLREIAQLKPNETSFLFLMPCHSTPLYSHLHVNVSARFLTCQPNFNKSLTYYQDEAEEFYENPNFWLRKHFPANGTLPSHIICFDSLAVQIQDILSRYKMIWSAFHASLSQNRVGRQVQIFQIIEHSHDKN